MPAGTGSDPTENTTSGADALAFLLIDTVSNTYAVWLKVIHDLRDAIIHMMDHVIYLLTQKENLEMADSSLCSFLFFFFSFYFPVMVNCIMVYNHLLTNAPANLTLEIFQNKEDWKHC